MEKKRLRFQDFSLLVPEDWVGIPVNYVLGADRKVPVVILESRCPIHLVPEDLRGEVNISEQLGKAQVTGIYASYPGAELKRDAAIEIDGVKGYETICSWDAGGLSFTQRGVAVQNGFRMLSIFACGATRDMEAVLPEVDGILGSFRFTAVEDDLDREYSKQLEKEAREDEEGPEFEDEFGEEEKGGVAAPAGAASEAPRRQRRAEATSDDEAAGSAGGDSTGPEGAPGGGGGDEPTSPRRRRREE